MEPGGAAPKKNAQPDADSTCRAAVSRLPEVVQTEDSRPSGDVMSDDAAPARRLPCSPGSVTDSTPGSGVAALVRASTAATPRRNAPSSPSSPGSSAITRLPQLPPAAWPKHAAVSSFLKTRCFLSFKAAQSAMDSAGLHEQRGTWIPVRGPLDNLGGSVHCLGRSARQYASLEAMVQELESMLRRSGLRRAAPCRRWRRQPGAPPAALRSVPGGCPCSSCSTRRSTPIMDILQQGRGVDADTQLSMSLFVVVVRRVLVSACNSG